MPERCTVCAHEKLVLIDKRLTVKRTPIVHLATEYGVTRDALMRHRDRHLHVQTETPPPTPLKLDLRTRVARRTPNPNAQEDFLEAYRTSGNFSHSARQAGVTREKVLWWQETDEQFSLAFHRAEIEAVEALEHEARERATMGAKLLRRVIRNGRVIEEVEEWRPSDAVLVKLLQALKPEKYGDKLALTQTQIVKTIDAEAWDSV
jgi:hypothetical protein